MKNLKFLLPVLFISLFISCDKEEEDEEIVNDVVVTDSISDSTGITVGINWLEDIYSSNDLFEMYILDDEYNYQASSTELSNSESEDLRYYSDGTYYIYADDYNFSYYNEGENIGLNVVFTSNSDSSDAYEYSFSVSEDTLETITYGYSYNDTEYSFSGIPLFKVIIEEGEYTFESL